MTARGINVEESIKKVKELLNSEPGISPALKSSIEVLIVLIAALLEMLSLNSKNSSKPPSSDPNREKKSRAKGERRPGGQKGHDFSTLQPVPDPDRIEIIQIDRSTLPEGRYRVAGYEKRQVVDIEISRIITEWQAEILEDQTGKRYTAPFPEGVTRPIQYGAGVKIHAVYMSQFQLIPYSRVEDHFLDQMGIPISAGTIYNFNQDAYDRLAFFEEWAKRKLIMAQLVHLDETGINICGKKIWLHNTSNDAITLFLPHEKRGAEAIDHIGILPIYRGVACHDHWKPYYRYDCVHALCNAHHLRELEGVKEQDKHQWAIKMSELLTEINKRVKDAGGKLDARESESYRIRYREILLDAEKECPPPPPKEKGKKGKTAKSKARNLLERLRDYEDDVLRFMDIEFVPFTNNQAENDLRMTKVQQKISGCFRSVDGAKIFCRVRSYLSTCRKNGVSASEALRLLFEGKLPAFIAEDLPSSKHFHIVTC
jgi:transposase